MAKSSKPVVKKTSTETTGEAKVANNSVAKPAPVKAAPAKAASVKKAPAKKAPTVAAAKSTAKPKAKTATKSPSKPKPAAVATHISPAERMKMIAEAAYYLAEARGFSQGNDVNDWVIAEQQVNAKLNR